MLSYKLHWQMSFMNLHITCLINRFNYVFMISVHVYTKRETVIVRYKYVNFTGCFVTYADTIPSEFRTGPLSPAFDNHNLCCNKRTRRGYRRLPSHDFSIPVASFPYKRDTCFSVLDDTFGTRCDLPHIEKSEAFATPGTQDIVAVLPDLDLCQGKLPQWVWLIRELFAIPFFHL